MARSKQGAVVRRGKLLYARIRWQEWEDGKRVQREKLERVRTITEGRERCKQLLRELEEDGTAVLDADRLTFAQLGARYREKHIFPAEYAGDHKIAGMRNTASPLVQLQACLDYFGDRLVKTIDYEDLIDFKRRRSARTTKRGRPPALATVHRELERLHALFQYAVRKKWLRRNPFDFGPPLINKSAEAIRERIPSAEEAGAILDQCTGPRAHLRIILMMIRDTGIRPSELFRARVQDLDFEARTLEITTRSSKTNRRRYVGLTSELQAELRRHIAQNYLSPGDLILGITNNVKRSYATACRLAGVAGVTLYAWRHLFGTDLQRAKVPVPFAMKVMGHTEEKTHRRYINADQAIAAQTAAELETYRQGREEVKRESGGEKKKTA